MGSTFSTPGKASSGIVRDALGDVRLETEVTELLDHMVQVFLRCVGAENDDHDIPFKTSVHFATELSESTEKGCNRRPW
jgi:hypothetical protein